MRFFSKIYMIAFVVAVVLSVSIVNANTIVISTGDYLSTFSTGTHSVDSAATIGAMFEAMKQDWDLNRVWWRGGQQKYFYEYADLVSDDSSISVLIWKWFFEHKDNVNQAVTICNNLGLEPWLLTGLFEFGGGKDSSGSRFPFPFEHDMRIEHPEWIPVNKYGSRLQGGPIEFCYPEARAAFIKNLETFLVQEGYKGIIFYTYAENFSTRYFDEFGFSQPIVDEFKLRYGVDIRTETFDKEAWAALRGEYVTQFLRELKAALQPYNIKVAIQMSPDDVNLPELWPGTWSTLERQRVGRILMDWHTWVDEELVYELSISYPGDVSVAQELIDYCQENESSVVVSMYRASGATDHPAGVKRISYFTGVATPAAVQSGFSAEESGSPVNNYPYPVQTLQTGNKWQKRQVLYLATLNLLTLGVNDIATASTDEDVFVRAMAVRALRETGLPEAVPFIEARLSDNENYVRCLAALELGNLCGSNSVQAMFDAIVPYGNYQYNLCAVTESILSMKNKGTLGTAQKQVLRNCLSHTDPNVRRAAMYAIGTASLRGEYVNEYLYIAANDADYFNRTLAMYSIAASYTLQHTYNIFRNNLEGTNQTFQVRAAEALGEYATLGDYKADILTLLLNLFNQYGSGNDRIDKEWGWRVVGNTIVGIEESALENLMKTTNDPKIAELAWRVIYTRQYRNRYTSVTEEQDFINHQLRPFNKVDIVSDGLIDFKDFAAFAESWLECNLSPQNSCY